MSLTPPTSSVIDIADHKIGDFNVEFLGEYEFYSKRLWISVLGEV
jgi:hypothetical protein